MIIGSGEHNLQYCKQGEKLSVRERPFPNGQCSIEIPEILEFFIHILRVERGIRWNYAAILPSWGSEER